MKWSLKYLKYHKKVLTLNCITSVKQMNPVNFSLLLGTWCNNKNSANGNWANTDLGPKLECWLQLWICVKQWKFHMGISNGRGGGGPKIVNSINSVSIWHVGHSMSIYQDITSTDTKLLEILAQMFPFRS